MTIFERQEKITNVRDVKEIEIMRLFDTGAHTIGSLEGLVGSKSVSMKLKKLLNKQVGVVRERSTILGNPNQYLYRSRQHQLKFDDVISNNMIGLATYFLRESLSLMVTEVVPILETDTSAKMRSFIALSLDDQNRSSYLDVRFSVYTIGNLNVTNYVTRDKEVNVIIFSDSRSFNDFKNKIMGSTDQYRNQIWLVLINFLSATRSHQAKGEVFANMQAIENTADFMAAFEGTEAIQTTRHPFYRETKDNYKKAKANAKRFRRAMVKGQERATEIRQSGLQI